MCALVLAGCATTAGYEKVLHSWAGSTELDIVRAWGPPAQAYDVGDRRFLVYSSNRNVVVPGVAPTYTTTLVGNTAYTRPVGGVAPSAMSLGCQTTFELDRGFIVRWQYQGNDCKAQE